MAIMLPLIVMLVFELGLMWGGGHTHGEVPVTGL